MLSKRHGDDPESVTPFAVTNYRDIRRVFGIKQKNRRGHMYLLGKTGTGKSTLLRNMVISDIRDGKGVALIDPHGDLVESVLDLVPERRIHDVVYFNPADTDHPIAFNPLWNVASDFRHLVASGLVGVLKKIWSESWGPRLEHILRQSLLTLLDCPNATLADLPLLLTRQEFRAQALQYVTDKQVRRFWTDEFNQYPARLRAEATAPILNKISQFLASFPVRNIIGQQRSAFRFRKLMDEGKVLLCNLAKGRIGADNCAFLGSILVAQIQLAAQSRANVAEHERKPFYLYVDETHNFLTLSFTDILSEARKYGLHLVLAHQYIAQLDPRIRAAIFGNVGTLISFRVGADDARYLAREFYPVFDQEALVNLPNHHIYLKLMIDGVSSRPFSACTLSPFRAGQSFKQSIIEASRATYARSRQEVEQNLPLQSLPADKETHARQGLLPF
jgi:hypothetical protein